MKENTRSECTPQEYIRKLFKETENGKLVIQYFPFFDQQYSLKYKMDWTGEDAEELVKKYDSLTSILGRIGQLHAELEDETKRQELLTEEELEVWDTYIRPFEPFEVDLDVIAELHFRAETDSLEDEEYELMERHYEWFVSNSRKRLPADRWCPAHFINRAQRYERLMERNAPETVVQEEGRWLAEEMVLYYHAVRQIVHDMLRFIMAQSNTYSTALEEIKNGKKTTHWMWFIFPQMRGLGTSEMSYKYGIIELDEARTYLEDIRLGPGLIEITEEVLKLDESDAVAIFGEIDAMKFHSSMTLFSLVSEKNSVFNRALKKFFHGELDKKTLEILASQG